MKFVFSQVLGIPYEICTDIQEFVAFNGPKLSYGAKKVHQDLHIYSRGILFQKGIETQSFEVKHSEEGLPYIFGTQQEALLPFDVFGAIFFFISRYEEYLPNARDEHGRFSYESSVAYQNGFLETPVVDAYCSWLGTALKDRFPELAADRQKFRATLTVDIDNAFEIRHKEPLRIGSILARNLFQFKGKSFVRLVKVLAGRAKDRYDNYEELISLIKAHKMIPFITFFLIGDFSKYDRNIHHKQKIFRALIKQINDYSDIGIHPSYSSHLHEPRVKMEKKRLEDIVHRDISKSRQHFLRFTLPKTYRILLEAGVREDYSMGYSKALGFRASTSQPFFFYDLDLEYETPLQVVPFCMMDATLKYHLGCTPEEAKEHMKRLLKITKEYQGVFVPIFHNEGLSDEGLWDGWKSVFYATVEEMKRALD